VIPQSIIDRHRRVQDAYTTLAFRDLVTVWRDLDLTDAQTATANLFRPVQTIVTDYGDLSAVEAADFYDQVRAVTNQPGRFAATPATTAGLDRLEALVRWAVTPIWSTDPDPDLALSRLAGGAQRIIREAERETIRAASGADGARYIRSPRFDACPFCLMLAARADLYESRESASVVVGRSGRTRGNRPMGERYHDHCRCAPVPIWTGDDMPEINRRLNAEWQQVTAGASGAEARKLWVDHHRR
jgi:hypothetical protein